MNRRDLEPRMLTQAQAAAYCGIGVKAFKSTCPVSATQLRNGLMRFDRYKLDSWLDSLTPDGVTPAPIDWLNRLYEEGGNERQRSAHQRAETLSR